MEILFRGKRKDNGEWVCSGSLFQAFNNDVKEIYIPKYGEAVYATYDVYTDHIAAITCDNDARFYNVDPETVGQYTGLTDKNGKQIFEGDIIKYKNTDGIKFNSVALTVIGKVVYNEKNASFAISGKDEIGAKYYDYFPIKNIEVIGNIHDDPELLRGDTNA